MDFQGGKKMENTVVSNKDVAEFLRDSVLQMGRSCKRKAILLLIACGILQCGSALSITGWQIIHGSMVVAIISLLACAGYIATQKCMIEDKTCELLGNKLPSFLL